MTVDPHRLAGDPDLVPLWQAVHDRLAAGTDPAAIVTVTVPDLPAGATAALRSWLDTPAHRRRGHTNVPHTERGTKVPLRLLLAALHLPPQALQPLVEQALGRAVINRKNGQLARTALRQELSDYAASRLPHLPRLCARILSQGIDSETAPEIRRLIDALASLTRCLPHQPPRALPKLAHDHAASDPHYFDATTLPGQRLITAVAELAGCLEPTRPDHIRALLAEYGILADRLSATVLLHQVKAIGDGPIDRRLNDATTPVALNLLDLTRTPPHLAPQTLTVIENPSVLEAAMERVSPHPMACTSGQLRAVDHALLQLAVDQGLHLRYAGDLDAAGFQIAAVVQQTYGAELIAMDMAPIGRSDAEAATTPSGTGDPVPDGQLSRTGRVLYQEHDAVLDLLFPPEGPCRSPQRRQCGEAGAAS
ncbi:DUF2399 domain-containing protein [Streptomyces sp. NPDC056723]|uniref:DUF2399 domain-containing protein n=1 Tax=Streptomyces sp. NPDC056723 TaxID=3345925 RepID=UPI003692A100